MPVNLNHEGSGPEGGVRFDAVESARIQGVTSPNTGQQLGATSLSRVLIIASDRRMGLTFNLTRLVLELHKQGQAVVAVANGKEQEEGLTSLLRRAGIPFYECRHVDGSRGANIIRGAIELSRVLAKERIDVVHCNGVAHLTKAYLAAKILNAGRRISLVTSVHSTLHNTSAG